MKRSAFKRFWMIVIFLLSVASFYVYQKAELVQVDIADEVRRKQRMQVELNSGSLVAKALEELDALVMNEHKATKLDALRYLGYEQSSFDINISTPSKVTFAGTPMFSRKVTVKGGVPYRVALSEIDRIYNSKKIIIESISLKRSEDYGDSVLFELSGTFYGVDKGRKS